MNESSGPPPRDPRTVTTSLDMTLRSVQDVRAIPSGARWLSRGSRSYRKAAFALFLAGFSTFSLLYCVQPLLPTLAQDFDVSPAVSSLSLSLSTAFLAVAIFGAAALSEDVGRRGLMFASMAIAASLTVAAAAAASWPVLLVIRALSGFALGGVPAVAMTYLAEEIEPNSLGFAMGLYVAGTAFGGMMGRIGGGVLAEALGWRWAVAIVGSIDLSAAIGFIALLPPSRNFVRRTGFNAKYHIDAWRNHLSHPALRMIFAVGFLMMGAFVTVYNYVEFRLMAHPFDLNQSDLGLISLVYVFGMAASSIAGALADRVGRRAALPIGILVTGAGVTLTALPDLSGVIAGVVLLTVGFFVSHSIASGWVGRLAQTTKGHAASLYLLAYYVGGSVAGSLGGWFWSAGGWFAVVAFTMCMLSLAFATSLRLRRVVRRERFARQEETP